LRVRQLVATRKHEQALNLCQKGLQAIRLNTREQFAISAHQQQYLQEAYTALLVKMKRFDQLKCELAAMEPDALDTYLRTSIETERAERESKAKEKSVGVLGIAHTPDIKQWIIYKCQGNEFSAQFYIMQLLRQKQFDFGSIQQKLKYYMGLFIHYNRLKTDFAERVRTLLKCAFSRFQLYTACDHLYVQV
jgi:hypothetical protein